MNHKFCLKQGHHEGRLIQAVCLEQQCKNDRLLCFYCKHQNHRCHQTAYFPKGLPASLETLNLNSRIENAPKQQQKIDKKFQTIKKGWQTIKQTMCQNLKSIQNQINLRYQTIQCTFSKQSVHQIKRKLSTEKIPEQQVEKYIKIINNVSQYQLNNEDKVTLYTKLKQKVLRDVFQKAAFEVQGLMQQIQGKSKNLDFGSTDLQDYIQNCLFLQSQSLNIQTVSQESKLFANKESSDEFIKRFQSQFDRTESQISQRIRSNQQEGNLSQNLIEFDKVVKIQQQSSRYAQIVEPHRHQKVTQPLSPPKQFKIKIGRSLLQLSKVNQEEGNLEEQTDSKQKPKRLQYRNILKLTNDITPNQHHLYPYDGNTIKCYKEYSIDFKPEDSLSISQLGKTKKKIKQDHANNQPHCNQSNFKQKIDSLFGDSFPNSGSKSSESESQIQNKPSLNQRQTGTLFGNFDFTCSPSLKSKGLEIRKADIKDVQQRCDAQLKYQIGGSQYIEIQRKTIKLPPCNQSKEDLYFPFVKIYGHNLYEIYDSLQLIDSSVVTKLLIYSDTTTLCVDDQCIELICSMKKLTSLIIYMTNRLDKKQVRKLVRNLSNLEELVLSQFNNMDVELATTIKESLPRLRRFYYSVDYKNHMQKMEENFEFFIDIHIPPTPFKVIQILADIPELQTLQLINLSHKVALKVPHVLKRMKNLKEISITNTNNQPSNSTQIVNYLASSQHDLTVFCAQNTSFKEESLIKIFKNNKDIKTLIINECLQLQNQTMQILSYCCPDLEQLSLMLTDSIHGREIYSFKDLRVLVLRGCWKIDQDCFLENIHSLSKLQCLSVSYNNYWFYDNLMNEIVKLTKLKFLNLDTTKVTDVGMRDIHKLSQLETLICGKTEISFEGLIDSLKNPLTGDKNYNIKKLGLSKDQPYTKELNSKQEKNKHDIAITEFHAQHLLALGRALPGLTHLSIGGFINPKKQYFQTLKNLKCLAVTKQQLASETQKWLVSKGVYINEDY